MISIEEAVFAYVAAWNENDSMKRRELPQKCWAESGTVTSDHEDLRGREALFEAIDQFRRQRPADQAFLTSAVEYHHTYFRFTGIVIRPDGTRYSDVLDVGEAGADGRIIRISTV
jgi:hypothetical protein